MIIKTQGHWQKNNTKLGLIGYILFLVVRAVPLISFLLFKLKKRANFSYRDALLLFFVLLVAFPTSLPRATMASYYLPIIVLYLSVFSKKHIYVLSFLVSFFLMFPIFNFFRLYDSSKINIGLNLLETAHMDAFHNFAQLYSQKLITGGRQLIGSILFFIQESQWNNRPVGSGQMLAEMNGYRFANISMPLWGEGFVNFGVLGICFFVVIIAFLNSFLDLFYKLKKNNIVIICFLFFLGFEFYLLRGDLYSSCKKLFSFVLALIIVKIGLKTIDFFTNFIKVSD